MALTGKTIGQLTYLNFPNNDTLIPVELSGGTYHIAFSAVNYTELTYSDLVTGSQAGELSPGHYYLMTDYQTCYDQPNYNYLGSPITTGNYKTGTTEPLLLLATSTTGFSPTVFSTLYPQDKISYDISWNITEVTASPAKGRITERIDDKNNRTDYDFRAVQFIRYVGFFSEDYLPGKVSIDGSGNVTGVGTVFTNYSAGQIIGIYYGVGGAPISCFRYYEVTSVTDNTNMTVTGQYIQPINNTYYSTGLSLPNYMSPFQCNVTGGTYGDSAEYYTFNDISICTNNYLGNKTEASTFLLSNNVFLNGAYNENYFEGNVIGNTFNDAMYGINAGAFFSYNIITNTFRRNTIADTFEYNIIDCDMELNTIGGRFQYNMLGDSDGQDFDYNVIAAGFEGNFITFANDDFANNYIGYNFDGNIIDGGFINNNIVGNFLNNYISNNDFTENIISSNFANNYIYDIFQNNTIGEWFDNNIIYSTFRFNTIGANTGTNTFGLGSSPGATIFQNNTIGAGCSTNNFSGNTESNTIGANCQNNNLDNNFSYNNIGANFQYNTIANDFGFGGGSVRGNIVGNGFYNNTVGEYCYDNTFGDECYFNNLSDNFVNNRASHGFNNVTINNLDTPGSTFENNNFTYGFFTGDLTLTGGTGGNPIFYSVYPTNVTKDAGDTNNYVTFLSGGSIVAQTIIV